MGTGGEGDARILGPRIFWAACGSILLRRVDGEGLSSLRVALGPSVGNINRMGMIKAGGGSRLPLSCFSGVFLPYSFGQGAVSCVFETSEAGEF